MRDVPFDEQSGGFWIHRWCEVRREVNQVLEKFPVSRKPEFCNVTQYHRAVLQAEAGLGVATKPGNYASNGVAEYPQYAFLVIFRSAGYSKVILSSIQNFTLACTMKLLDILTN